MKVYTAEHIRNVALISHVGSGKTSLVDASLYDSGAVTRQGKVDEGSSIGDHDPDELKRSMTLNAKVLPVEWKNTKINLIDTPGYADFVGEVKAALRVADAALVVVTAEKGVEVGTELTWQYADERNLPRLVLVNKLDRENTSFEQALESLRSRFGLKVVPLQLPIGEQSGFKGVVDLVTQKAYTFEGGNKVQEIAVPDDLKERISSFRDQLIESAVESDDAVMEKFLEGEELSDAEILSVVKLGTRTGQLTSARSQFDDGENFRVAQFFAFQEFLHHRVVAFNRRLDQLIAERTDTLFEIIRDGDFLHFIAAFEGVGFLRYQVHYALKAGLLADGELQWDDFQTKAVAQRLERLLERCIFSIQLVHQHETRQVAFVRVLPGQFGADLNPFFSRYHDERGVGHTQRGFDLAHEVSITGSVNKVDFGILPFDGQHLCVERHTPFEFIGVVIGDRATFIDFALSRDRPTIIQRCIYERCFTCSNMGNQRYI